MLVIKHCLLKIECVFNFDCGLYDVLTGIPCTNKNLIVIFILPSALVFSPYFKVFYLKNTAFVSLRKLI